LAHLENMFWLKLELVIWTLWYLSLR
jgi:hypothetical protein